MLQIKTTGYEDFLDGSGNIKMLVIGGPDAGKTRSSSYWPKPFFLDCENSRGSLSDRKMPYVVVKNSVDALDALAYLKTLESVPKKSRQYQTIVLDTLDAFQRSVKDEWLQATKAGAFKGYDAWGYLDTKMSMLMTRLLNLDYNVLVLCHYKDKTLKDDDGKESRELMLQLQGDIKDTAFNDFGLVGWLGTYWETDGDKGRVEKRGLTFKKTQEKPFLKDRFAILPAWVPIVFSEDDYQQIYDAFLAQLDDRDLPDAEVLGEVPDAGPEALAKNKKVVDPMAGGPVPVADPSQIAVEDMSKPQLLEVVAKENIKVKGNALKAELITAINEARATAPASEPIFDPQTDAVSASEPAAETTPQQLATAVSALHERVNPEPAEENTGPAVLEEHTSAAETVVTQFPDARVVSDTVPTTAPSAPAEPPDFMAGNCSVCGKPLADQTRDLVRLSFIKFRKGYQCDDDYAASRAAAAR